MASVFKREWTTKSGQQRVAYRVQYYVKGKARWKQLPTERKAKRFVETLATVKARELAAPSTQGPRIEEVARRFLRACEAGRNGAPPLEPETVVFYRGHLEHHILPELGHKRVGDLTGEDVREFRNGLLEDRPRSRSPSAARPATFGGAGRASSGRRPPQTRSSPLRHRPDQRRTSPSPSLSRSTARKVLTTLKTLVGYALEEGEIQSDPTHRVTIRISSRDRKKIEIHSKAEMRLLLSTAEALRRADNQQTAKQWSRYYPLVMTLVYAGLRISEARGLRRMDVDLDARVIEVHQRADRRGRIGVPKSAAGTRRVHIPEALCDVLRSWLQTHHHELVWPTKSGRPLDTNNFRKQGWDNLQRRAHVRQLTLHSARHFFASREIEAGLGLKELSEVMGHSDPAFTLKVYGHLFRDAAAEKKRAENAARRVL